MEFLVKIFSMALLMGLISCGSPTAKEAKTTVATQRASDKEVVSKTEDQVVETTTTTSVRLEEATKEAVISSKEMLEKAEMPIPKKVKPEKEVVKVSMDEKAITDNKVVKEIKKTAEATKTTKIEEPQKETIKIEGAKEITSNTKTTVEETTAPKITELPTKETVKEAAATSIAEKKAAAEKKPAPTTVDHSPWDQLLTQYVSAKGKVNYKGLKAKESALNGYLKTLSRNPVKPSWSKSEQMAYWINAYNAFTVKLILDNYPVKSIMDLHGGKAWDHSWIKIGDKTYTLNDIEHKILRPQFKDARIHFAVNCAASSCPPLLNRAWTASNLKTNLAKQTKQFIANANYNKIGKNQVEISKIFDWYKEDFGDLITYLNKYVTTPIEAGTEVNFKEYDWALNQ